MIKKVNLKERNTNENIYPITSWNCIKDFPQEGKAGLILTTDGLNLKWTDINILDILTYGVEWDVNSLDPHLTRIGNMSFHKTLPIQSQLKGCIALGSKIIYWLDENDWRFRKDPNTITVDLTASTETFAVPSTTGLGVNQYLRSGSNIAKITAIDGTNITVEWESLTGTVTSLEIGSRLDGYDGTVRVFVPEFYIKSEIEGDKRRVLLSSTKIDDTWTHLPAGVVDAYRSTRLRSVPTNMGYLSTLPVDSAISVVNTADYCRGGNNQSTYDKYLTGADGTTIDIFRSQLGKPATALPRATMRNCARNAGSEMLSYDLYKNIFYWLYVVEYANFNCLEAFNEVLTEDGYHQGGLGNGITTIGNWGGYNGYYPICPCGYTNELGNGTGIKNINIPSFTFTSEGVEKTQGALTLKAIRWRGFENTFGDIWTNLDGIIIDSDSDNHPNNMNYVYTCQDPSKYTDTLTDDYKKVGEEIHQDGYTKLFDLGEDAHIIPHVMGGNTTKGKCDYHWTGNKNAALRTLLVGGSANYGSNAGLGYFASSNGVSSSAALVGFRSGSFPFGDFDFSFLAK